MVSINFIGLFAPAHTPGTITDRTAQATRVAMSDRDLQQKYRASGFDPSDSDPETARRILKEQIVRWTPIIRAIGLTLD